MNEIKDLLDHLLKLDNRKDMESFLRSILTPAEFEEVVQRLQIVKHLKKGMPQREIAEKLGVGIATVTRGSREIKRGGFSTYNP